MPHPEAIFMGFRGPEALLNLHGGRLLVRMPFLRHPAFRQSVGWFNTP
jgi:hypothetical protein